MTSDYAPPTWDQQQYEPPVTPNNRTRLWFVVGGVVCLALVLYVVAAWVLSAKIARGTTVSGLAIGGLSGPRAERKIHSAFTALDDALPVRAAGTDAQLELANAGLTVDARATVKPLVGFTLNPFAIVRHAKGGDALEAGSPSSTRLVKSLQALAGETDRKPADAAVSFRAGRPALRAAVTGAALQVPSAATIVTQNWLSGGRLELPAVTTEPEITQAKGEAALERIAKPAVSGPLKLDVGDESVTVSAAKLGESLSVANKGGELQLVVDGKKLRHRVLEDHPNLGIEPKDARIVLTGGRPVIIPGVAGTTIDDQDLAKVVLPALSSDRRSATVKTRLEQPDLTTSEAKKLGVKEKVSTFSTNLTVNKLRTENLQIAARYVNGTLVLPGQTFSLNQVLGERTPAKGYNMAPTIQGGHLVPDFGGGVSQMATTIFNNVFFAGLQDVTHQAHSFYISRYPEGREATVNYPTVDLKWRNDSKYGVLVQATVDAKQVHVSFWSTTVWDITAGKSARTDVSSPKTVYDETDDCVPQEPSDGFRVTVTRTFRRPGSSAVVRTQTFSTTYVPENHVICGPKP